METENRYIETDLGNVAPNPRGDYSAETTYEYLDLVVYQGGSYLCVVDTSQGTAPEPGKTTAVWQVLTLPGDLTPEYVAMHDDVVNKAASAAEDAASTATDRAATTDMKEDVEQLQREVAESAASAKADKESAAGYAAAAEASRKAAAEAEANVTAQVTGFDEHVAEKTEDATTAIVTERTRAIQAVDSATQAAKSAASSAAGSASTATRAASTAASQAAAAEAASKTATSAASETVKTAKAAQEDIATAKSNTIKAVQEAATEEKKAAAASAENAATSAESAKTSADNAAQSAKSVEDASKQIEQNKKDVASLKEDLSNKITKFYASNQGETNLTDSDNGKIMDMMLYGKSSQDGTPTPDNPVEIKSVVNPTVKVTNEDGLKVQSVTLNNITLNAIPVSSGGNVTIDGQQYIADYVDVERGKLVKKLKRFTISDIETIYTWGVNENADNITGFYFYMSASGLPKSNNEVMTSTILRYVDNAWGGKNVGCAMSLDSYDNYAILSVPTNMLEDISSNENACASLVKICENTNAIFFYIMPSPIETNLTPEEIEAFKELVTYYPVTSISVNSEQLDGCAVFNYPISIKNGWNYIKKQLNDNRDYIYDMDLQSAEAYVNSEYAVALTELEV